MIADVQQKERIQQFSVMLTTLRCRIDKFMQERLNNNQRLKTGGGGSITHRNGQICWWWWFWVFCFFRFRKKSLFFCHRHDYCWYVAFIGGGGRKRNSRGAGQHLHHQPRWWPPSVVTTVAEQFSPDSRQFWIKKHNWGYPRPKPDKNKVAPVPSAGGTQLSQAKKELEETESWILIFLCTSRLSLSAIPNAAPGSSSLYYPFRGFHSVLFFHSCKEGSKAQEEADAISGAPCCPLKH